MATLDFTSEFKDEAVRLITERGYSIAKVSASLGVSEHSLCAGFLGREIMNRITTTKGFDAWLAT
jgi:transposase